MISINDGTTQLLTQATNNEIHHIQEECRLFAFTNRWDPLDGFMFK
jgi:hypothetical protein